MKWVLGLLTVALIVVHQDFWNWDKISAIGGFLPVGLWYHALFCVAASVLLGLFVRFAWPAHLESAEREIPASQPAGSNHDH